MDDSPIREGQGTVEGKFGVDEINRTILATLNISPIVPCKFETRSNYAFKKVDQITSSIMETLNVSKIEKSPKESDFDELIHLLKAKFKGCASKKEKFQILTLLPSSWSIRRIENEFECSYRMAITSKALRNDKGILSVPDRKKPSHIIDQELSSLIDSFYIEDDVSSLMPGKNDYVSMTVNGMLNML